MRKGDKVKVNNEDEKIRLDKEKIISNAITGTIIIVVSFIVIFCFVTIFNSYMFGKNSFSENVDGMDRIKEAINKIKSEYIDAKDLTDEELIDGAITGIADATGDIYTRYMSEEEYQELLTSGTEVYGGIGVHLNFDTTKGAIKILGIMPDSPALKEDVKIGDLIIKVEDIEVTQENYNDCVNMIKGDVGTPVNLTFYREGQTIQKTIQRENVTASNVESEILNDNIGYIRIWGFENDVYKQFKQEYDKLKSSNIRGLIIDLRNNPGGLVSETISIAKLLLPQGELLKLVYNTGKEKIYKDDDDKEIDIPLAVIVNGNSASASEILSGAIKDSNKGVVIGTKTYGKGIVQTIEKLSTRGALAITTSKYYTASGIEIHKNGIEPNIIVELPDSYKREIYVPRNEDTQLNAAIEYIKSK